MAEPIYRFLEYAVVPERCELLRDDQPVLAEPKVYALILYLLQHRDRAISKIELQEAIWPNVVVTESALTRCVMKARQAVGDDAKQQRVIRTIGGGGYRFVAAVREVADPDPGPGAIRDRTPIAVLPFTNLSGPAEHAAIADGLALDIATDLSRNAWLFVVAPGSLQHHRSRDIDFKTLVEEFRVQYVVEGSVRRAGNRLRVNAALVDATTGAREWSERYDQEAADLFDIQDDITQQIVASLASQVRRAEGRKSVRADSDALDVLGLLHKGMAISWSRFCRESNLAAEALYREALGIEPENGRALAFLATSIAMKISNGWSQNIAADSYAAWSMGNKAIGLLPDDPMVLANYGHLNTCLGKASKAVNFLTRSIELDPSSAWSMGLLAFALTCCGRADDAIGHLMNALRLSPRDAAVHWYRTMLAWAYLQKGQYEDAAREAQHSINAFSGWSVAWATLAVARAGAGQPDDAGDALATCRRLDELATRDGYDRFFAYVVRDDDACKAIRGWLAELWSDPAPPREIRGPA